MTDQTPPQCGRTFVHLPHPTTEGDCPGLDRLDPPLFPIDRAPLIIRLGEGNQQPEVLNPEVLDGRGYLVLPHEVEFISFPAYEPDDRPLNETLADLTSDPLRAWMLRFPGPTDLDPGTGPGWGDDSDVETGRCCPWCRGSLTEHNRQVHGAGYAMGERHATEQPAASADYFTAMGSRGERQPDPWASDGAGYDVRVLRAGLQAIAADALTRDDFGTAAYAYSVLDGKPIPPEVPEDPDPLGDGTDPEAVEALLDAAARWGQAGVIRVARAIFHADAWHTTDPDPDQAPEPSAEDLAPRVYVGDRREVTFLGEHVPPTGVLLLPGEMPDEGPITASDLGPLHVPEPNPLCGKRAYGMRFAMCDLPAGHQTKQHHSGYDAGHGPTTVLWED